MMVVKLFFSIVAQYAQYIIYRAELKWGLILPYLLNWQAVLTGNLSFWNQLHPFKDNTKTWEYLKKILYPSVHHLKQISWILLASFSTFSPLLTSLTVSPILFWPVLLYLRHVSFSSLISRHPFHLFSLFLSLFALSLSLCFPLHQCYHTVSLM